MESEMQKIVRSILKMVESGDVVSVAFAIEHKNGTTSSAKCEAGEGCDTTRLIGAIAILQTRLVAEYVTESRCEEHTSAS